MKLVSPSTSKQVLHDYLVDNFTYWYHLHPMESLDSREELEYRGYNRIGRVYEWHIPGNSTYTLVDRLEVSWPLDWVLPKFYTIEQITQVLQHTLQQLRRARETN